MSWEEVGAIGQMIGSVAVLATLGYLSVQLGHARRERQRSISQARADGVRQNLMTMAMDSRMGDVSVRAERALGAQRGAFATAMIERAGLSEVDARALMLQYFSQWQVYAQQLRDFDELLAGERAALERSLRNIYSINPVGRLWYETMKSSLNPDAVHYIDNLLAQPG